MEREEFELNDDDYYAINIAKNLAYKLLKYPNIKPQQIIGIGNALYSLDRLPEPTPGAFTEFGIVYRNGTDEFNETRYINFLISESVFEISIGGSVYDQSIGSDSFSEPGWLVDIGGCRDTQLD